MVDLALLQSVSYIAGALGVCVAAIYYVMTLRVQQTNMKATLQTREANLYMQILNKIDTLEFQTIWFDVMNWEFKTPEEFTENIWPIKENKAKMAYVGLLLEGVGVAVKKKLINIDLIDDLFSMWVIGYWEKYGPCEIYFRERFKAPQNAEFIEFLYDEVVKVNTSQYPALEGKTKSILESHLSKDN